MGGYTKLFSSIVASTIWRETKETKIVWITMLAMADASGRVDASVPGLADLARVTVQECSAAIEVLSGPDSWSRSKEFEGRRIEPVDGGWNILNYSKYRENRDGETRREQNRLAQKRYRDRHKQVSQSNADISQDKPQSAQAEAEAEAIQSGKPADALAGLKLPFASDDFKSWWECFVKHRMEKRDRLTPTAAGKQLAKLAKMGEARAIAAIEHSVANGWTGIFEPSPTNERPINQKPNTRSFSQRDDYSRAPGQ